MLHVVPLTSPLHGATARDRLAAAFAAHLDRAGVSHTLVREPALAAPRPAGPVVLALLTGGTEAAALTTVADVLPGGAPVVLLTHGLHNGFPAALEVAARLRATGRRVRVLTVDREGTRPALQRTLAALAAHERLRRSRLLLLGGPSDWLVASAPDDATVQAVFGVQVVRAPLRVVEDAFAAVPSPRAQELAIEVIAGGSACAVRPAEVERAARLALALDEVVRGAGAQAVAVRCFDLLGSLGTTGCLGLSRLLDQGVMAGCEGDVPTTMTMLWLHALTGELPFMANPQEIDEATGQVDFAHCTIARRLCASYRLETHFESDRGVGLAGALPLGPVTVARLGGADLRALFAADGRLTGRGDSPDRCRTQVEVDLGAAAAEILRRPVGNHHVLVPGHHAALAREAHELFVAPGASAP